MALSFGLGHVQWAPWSGTSWLCLLLIALIYISYAIELRAKRDAKKVAVEAAVAVKGKSLEEPLIRAEAGGAYGTSGGSAPAKAYVVAGIAMDADKVLEVTRVGVLCFWMVLCSMAIIYTNAWILDNMCPHAATLTAIQQGFGAIMAAACVFLFKMAEPVEGMTATAYCKFILPLSLCFTVYLWGSNAAYIYLAPGFVQMIKPMGSAIVFLVATALGLEEYSHYKAVNFVLICAGIAVTAYSKFDGSLSAEGSSQGLVTVGLVVLIGAYTVVAFYNTGLQMLQKRGVVAGKFNPMTTLLYIAPATALSMVAFAAATEWNQPDFQCFDKLPLWLLALDCCVAFVFNLSMMLFIGKLSAVAYSVFAFFKEICLVLVAFLLFSEDITRCEVEGYLVTLIAVIVWQHRKLAGN